MITSPSSTVGCGSTCVSNFDQILRIALKFPWLTIKMDFVNRNLILFNMCKGKYKYRSRFFIQLYMCNRNCKYVQLITIEIKSIEPCIFLIVVLGKMWHKYFKSHSQNHISQAYRRADDIVNVYFIMFKLQCFKNAYLLI